MKNYSKKLNIIGGVFVLIGLLLALYANNYISKANNLLVNRVIVKDFDRKSLVTLQIKNKIKISNAFFLLGWGLTGVGVILQIIGTAVDKNLKIYK